MLQLGFHAVEGIDVSQLERQRLFAGEPHGQQREAVAREAVGGAFFPFGICKFNQSKIRLVLYRQVGKQVSDAFHHMQMLFAKVQCNFIAGCGGLAINKGDSRGKSQSGLRHDATPVREMW